MSAAKDHGLSDVSNRVSEALEVYAAAMDSGHPMSRKTLLKQYADVADELAGCLDGLQLIREVAPQLEGNRSEGPSLETHPTHPRDSIGDYRIIREIGRGGMGVVYEAEQLSLGRSVALKVLPFAAILDQKAITRFKNEARAAGTLDHPHIVPVHAVGNERGIYFYAMSLIDGLTLAELVHHLQAQITDPSGSSERLSIDDILNDRQQVRERRSTSQLVPTIDRGQKTTDAASERTNGHVESTDRDMQAAILTHRSRFGDQFFRAAARLGAEAAEALDHAHQHGIVHRDVKPGNLMIDKDAKLWVTDFGLARIESEAGMTMTGDLMGTLRYMAPEQALANRIVVDHRADIYSLGASLYELLALRAPFDGRNREELLNQIASEEPSRLRHVNRAVPEDLQTIVHKAISKNPDDRYNSAQEMADDLRSYIEDKPIQARPLSLAQRTTRWAARRKGLVASFAAVLILAVISLSISNAMIAHQRNVATMAGRRERLEKQEADRQRQLADANAKRARETVDTYLTKVSEDELLNAPSMQPLRKELLELALNYYNEFIQQQPDDPELHSELADAYERVGSITTEIGSAPAAIEAYEKALGIRERLVASDPEKSNHQQGLATSKRKLGNIYASIGQNEKALALVQAAIRIGEQLVERSPTDTEHKIELATAYSSLVRIYSETGQGFLTCAQKVVQITESLVELDPDASELRAKLARAYHDVAAAHIKLGETEQAQVDMGKAIAIKETLVEQHPATLRYQQDLAHSYRNFANIINATRPVEALELLTKAIALDETLAEQNPYVVSYRLNLSRSHDQFSHLYWQLKQIDNAVASANNAISIRENLVIDHPRNVEYQDELASTYLWLGRIQRGLGQVEEALTHFRKALSIQEDLAQQNPDAPRYQMAVADALRNLAIYQKRCGKSDQAIRNFSKAIEILENLVEQNPEVPRYQRILALSHLQLSDFPSPSRLALPHCENAIAIFENLMEKYPKDPTYTVDLAQSLNVQASFAFRADRAEDAIPIYRKAITLLEKLVDEHPETTSYQVILSASYSNLAGVYNKLGQVEAAMDMMQNVNLVQERAAIQNPKIVEYQDVLGKGYINTAILQERANNSQEALATLEKAIAIYEKLVATTPQALTYQTTLAKSYTLLSTVHHENGNEHAAAPIWSKVIQIGEDVGENGISLEFWGYLAQAYYRSERFTEAKHALEKSLELRGETEPTIKLGPRWWYMAMLLARTGERDTARAYYDRLVSEIDDFTAADARLRVELAALLGIEESEPAPADGVSVSTSAVRAA